MDNVTHPPDTTSNEDVWVVTEKHTNRLCRHRIWNTKECALTISDRLCSFDNCPMSKSKVEVVE
jgi:hypothetical protein